MTKILILRVINRFNVGGISYNVAYLSKFLKSHYETKIFGGKHEKNEESSKYLFDELGLKIHHIPYLSRSINLFYDFLAIIFFVKKLYKFKPHIIHSHASKAGLLTRVASLFYWQNSKIVHTYHGNVFDGYFSPLKQKFIVFIERLLAKRTDIIIAISEKQKHDLEFKYKIAPGKKIRIVKLGFDLSKFINNQIYNSHLIKKEFSIDGDRIILTTVGRLVPIKNQILFLQVLKKLKFDHGIKVCGLIVGDGEERGILEEFCMCNNLIIKSDVNKNNFDIIFTSWRKDIPAIYSISDFVLLTSINEGTPVSIIEAMASKKVVLSTNVGGVSDIITDNTGFICDNDPTSFVDIILKLLSNNLLYNEISTNARIRVGTTFNYSNLCRNMELVYEDILN